MFDDITDIFYDHRPDIDELDPSMVDPGKPFPAKEEIVAAALRTYVHSWISKLPGASVDVFEFEPRKECERQKQTMVTRRLGVKPTNQGIVVLEEGKQVINYDLIFELGGAPYSVVIRAGDLSRKKANFRRKIKSRKFFGDRLWQGQQLTQMVFAEAGFNGNRREMRILERWRDYVHCVDVGSIRGDLERVAEAWYATSKPRYQDLCARP